MEIIKEEKHWTINVGERDSNLGMINIIRYLDQVITEIDENPVEELALDLNLSNLTFANSELIAQFVNLQTHLVRHNGRLRIVDAHPMLKSTFDVVMLDKIISVNYNGLEESDDYEFDDDEDDDDDYESEE